MISLTRLLDDAKCYEALRRLRWPDGVKCPHCGSPGVTKQGMDAKQPQRQDYRCGGCGRHFDDLSETIFAGRHQSLQVWIGCLYLMGLNLSNRQIAHELDLNEDDVQRMTEQLRKGILASQTQPDVLSGNVECHEVYVVAGHKGHPEEVKKKGGQRAGAGSRERLAEEHWRKKSPPSSA